MELGLARVKAEILANFAGFRALQPELAHQEKLREFQIEIESGKRDRELTRLFLDAERGRTHGQLDVTRAFLSKYFRQDIGFLEAGPAEADGTTPS